MKRRKRQKINTYKTPIWIHLLMIICGMGMLLFAFVFFLGDKEYSDGNKVYEQIRPIPNIDEPDEEIQPMYKVDFDYLKEINNDIVGWIQADDKIIDYPIVKGQDNDYYLNHLFNHKQNKLGSIFMDYRNWGDFSDRNTILYGHNMHDGSMFSSLTKYKKQSYYDSYPNMLLYNPTGEYMIEFFAGIVSSGDIDFIRFAFDGDDDFLEYMSNVKKGSTFQSDISIVAGNRAITLTTCSYDFENARYALFGRIHKIK